MIFETQIFIPSKKSRFDFTLSEKLTYYSLFTCFFCCIILLINQKYIQIEIIELILKSLGILVLPIAIIGMTIRFWEYENLNGSFRGELKVDLISISISNSEYLFSKVENFKISISNYKGQRTNNTKSGPSFYQGTSNFISFTHNSESISVNFLLLSKDHIDDFYEIFVSIIAQEKITYCRNLINLIPEKYRKSQEFRNFILKLITEKRIECIEGLLIHGYSSDEEAKQLRLKYCS